MNRIYQMIISILIIALAVLWGGLVLAVQALLLSTALGFGILIARKLRAGEVLSIADCIAVIAIVVTVFFAVPNLSRSAVPPVNADVPTSPGPAFDTVSPTTPLPLPAGSPNALAQQNGAASQSGSAEQNVNGPVTNGGTYNQGGPITYIVGGSDGALGRDGQDGQDGQDGAPGRDGQDGTPGRDGRDGQDGAPGRDGRNGQDSMPGRDGRNGQDGVLGRDGRDGRDGQNGRDGRDGRDGKDGAPGKIIIIVVTATPQPATPTVEPPRPTVEPPTVEPATPTVAPPTPTVAPPTPTVEPPTVEPPTPTVELPTPTVEPPTPTVEPPTPTATACPPDQVKKLDIMLVIDRSGSMGGREIEAAQQAAITFLKLVDAADQTGLVSFAKGATLDHPLSTDPASVAKKVAELKTGGDTHIEEAIDLATTALSGDQQREDADKVLILLTDGLAKGRDQQVRDAAARAKQQNVRIITVGLGKLGEEEVALLRDITSAPQTDYLASPTADELQAIYIRISEIIHACSVAPVTTGVHTQAASETS